MLRFLSITDFAIIDRLEVELAPGLNVLTGETGAGKSILVDAMAALVGTRADASWVRTGSTQARVQGVFVLPQISADRVSVVLDEYGLEHGSDELIVAREVNRQGRNLCRLNGHIVPLRVLSAVGEHLVDIHGQGEHLSLLKVAEHINLLDRYVGHVELREEVAGAVGELRGLTEELERLKSGEREAAHRADLLAYQVREVQEAGLEPGEDEELVRERALASNAQKLIGAAMGAYVALHEGPEHGGSAAELLSKAAASLAQVEDVDGELATHREALEALAYQAEDLARELRSYCDRIEHDPARLEAIEERLDLIFRLKRKYGDTIEDVIRYKDEGAAELESLNRGEDRISELEAAAHELRARIGTAAVRLSDARQQAAGRLTGAAEAVLADLAMASARVEVDIHHRESDGGVPVPADGAERRLAFDATGVDQVELLLSANPGEPPKPLAKVSSGGESSRLMLAMKVVLAQADQVPSLVFDEIDSGIGGRVGAVVGSKLHDLSASHQVLCVTHLPQIAAFADRHLRVAKGVEGVRTTVEVEVLLDEQRVHELGNMLGGSGEAAYMSARELLADAAASKGLRARGRP